MKLIREEIINEFLKSIGVYKPYSLMSELERTLTRYCYCLSMNNPIAFRVVLEKDLK